MFFGLVVSLLLQLLIVIFLIVPSSVRLVIHLISDSFSLLSYPDMVSSGSVSDELFNPFCHSLALSTSLVRKVSSSRDNGSSCSTILLILLSLDSSSHRGTFESSMILISLWGRVFSNIPLLFCILSVSPDSKHYFKAEFPAAVGISRECLRLACSQLNFLLSSRSKKNHCEYYQRPANILGQCH